MLSLIELFVAVGTLFSELACPEPTGPIAPKDLVNAKVVSLRVTTHDLSTPLNLAPWDFNVSFF